MQLLLERSNARLLWFLAGCVLLPFSLLAAPREFGADVSHYQGASGVSQSSWNQMYAEGKRFVFIKGSEGLTGPDDAAMTNNLNRSANAGILAGVYHYPHPENRPTTAGAIQEADHFLSYAGLGLVPGRLRPVLDVEGSAANLTTAALTDWVIAFCNRIVEQRGAGARPIIYVNRSFARDELYTRMAPYDLWLAHYTNVDFNTAEPPPTASYPDPTGVFTNWSFWQYTSSGSSGGISPLDLDVCHTEYKPLSAYLIPAPAQLMLQDFELEAGSFRLGFTNVPGTHFTVLAASDPALPLAAWTILGAATEGPPGNFEFNDFNAAGNPQRYYRVRSP